MKTVSSRLRRLQWKLTLSYTLVTVSALLVLSLAAIAFSVLTDVPDAAGRSVSLTLLSNRVADASAPYLASSPADTAGLQRRLYELRTLSPSLTRTPSLDNRWAQGQGPVFLVLDAEARVLGSLPPMANPAVLGQPLESGLLPGLDELLAFVQAGRGTVESASTTTTGERGIRVTAILGDDRALLGLVVALAGPAAFSSGLWEALSSLLAMLLIIVAGAGAIGTLFGFLTARGLSRRIGNLAAAAGAWSRGDFSAWLDDRSGDEVGELSRQMNRTAEQLQNLLRVRQELATMKERERLARDLHDSVKQQVFATAMQLAAAQALLDRDQEGARARLAEAEALTRQAQKELALLIQELRPADLEGRGLAPALRDYAGRWSRQTGIAVEVELAEGVDLTPEVENALFRIAQEALANVARHSGALTARLRLRRQEGTVVLEVADEGAGFDLAERAGRGLGLASMRERIEAIGGRLVVRSGHGTGTCVQATCPLPGLEVVRPLEVQSG